MYPGMPGNGLHVRNACNAVVLLDITYLVVRHRLSHISLVLILSSEAPRSTWLELGQVGGDNICTPYSSQYILDSLPYPYAMICLITRISYCSDIAACLLSCVTAKLGQANGLCCHRCVAPARPTGNLHTNPRQTLDSFVVNSNDT